MRREVFKKKNLYLVTGEGASAGRSTFEVVEASIRGGVDIVQMREKSVSGNELRDLGKRLSLICRKKGVVFIVNDDPELARDVGASGVHLGQEDIMKCSVDKARDIIGPDGIIGISTHSFEQAVLGMSSQADYIAYGPIFPTKTKDYFIGTEGVGEVLKIGKKPVVLIGGICLENIDEVLSLGARNIAMIRGITSSPDIESTVRDIKGRIDPTGCMEKKINVRINGKTQDLAKAISIWDFVEDRGLIPGHIVIEYNGNIIPSEKWPEVFISGGDNVEIVSFVGGG